MNLFTKIDIPEADFQIDYKSKLAFIGSCLADNISRRFAERKFHVLANPFGVVYNPLSIESLLKRIAEKKEFCEEDVFFDGEKWNCWEAHGSFSVADAEQNVAKAAGCKQCVEKLNRTALETREFLKNANVIFITLGTAFVYFLKETGKAVANCHRQKADLFDRRLISVEEAAEALRNIVRYINLIKQPDPRLREDDNAKCLYAKGTADADIRQHDNAGCSCAKGTADADIRQHDNAGCSCAMGTADADIRQHDGKSGRRDVKIVFTVSPLRHMHDGAHENNLSKATLHLAIEKVRQEFSSVSVASDVVCFAENDSSAVNYFPSYEIVMDELRDYRFYADDMIHLSATAEDYIFERMQETYCSDKTIAHTKYVEKFMRTAGHRIVDENNPRTVSMAKQQIEMAEHLEQIIDGLDLSQEKAYYKRLIP